MGAMGARTRDRDVDALKIQVETQTNALKDLTTQVKDLRNEAETATTEMVADLRIADLRIRVTLDGLETRVETARRMLEELRNEAETSTTLRTQVEALTSYVEDLRNEAEPTEVDILRTQVETLVAVASNEVDALRTQVETLVETAQTAKTADVVNLRFLVETLAVRLVAVIASDEIEVLNTQVETLREIMYCSIAQTENVRQYLETRTTLELTLILPWSRTPMVESCMEVLSRRP